MKVDQIVSEGAARASNKIHRAPVTRETLLHDGGQIAKSVMLQCTHEIAALTKLALTLADASDAGPGKYQLRAAAARSHKLNSLLMSYFDGHDDVTMGEVANEVMLHIDFEKEAGHV